MSFQTPCAVLPRFGLAYLISDGQRKPPSWAKSLSREAYHQPVVSWIFLCTQWHLSTFVQRCHHLFALRSNVGKCTGSPEPRWHHQLAHRRCNFFLNKDCVSGKERHIVFTFVLRLPQPSQSQRVDYDSKGSWSHCCGENKFMENAFYVQVCNQLHLG